MGTQGEINTLLESRDGEETELQFEEVRGGEKRALREGGEDRYNYGHIQAEETNIRIGRNGHIGCWLQVTSRGY